MNDEPKKLKPGDKWNYEIGGMTLTVEPVPYGQLKKLMKLVFGALDKIQTMDAKEVMLKLPEIFEENLGELISLMFKKKTHQFITKEWVDENVTLVDMEQIIEKAIIVNGLKDFLERMGLTKKQPAPSMMVVQPDSSTSGPPMSGAVTKS